MKEEVLIVKAVGIIRPIDRLGRLVIPKEFRKQFGLFNTVEVVGTDKGVLIRPSSQNQTER